MPIDSNQARRPSIQSLCATAQSADGAMKILDLHLLELAGAEDEVARGDLVAEGLADLGDAEEAASRGRCPRRS
jgi:hypothetical protein